MALLDEVLAANSALMERTDVPVPRLAEGRRVVIVTCSEIRAPLGRDIAMYFGLAPGDAFVVANAGARVHDARGDVARSVAVALAAAGGGEVFVVAHENCTFLHADVDSLNALIFAPTSDSLVAAESLCGENFISARKLAITSAENLRASPFVAASAAVHAMLFAEGRGRLTSEQQGYGVSAASASAAPVALGMSASPSPILAAHGSVGGFAPGPVSIMSAGPSPLMGAPSALMGMGSPSALMGATSPDFGHAPAPAAPPGFSMPTAPSSFAPSAPSLSFDERKAPPPAGEPPPLEPVTFFDPPPPPPPRKPGVRQGTPRPPDLDDPFRRAAETLERLRRERRK